MKTAKTYLCNILILILLINPLWAQKYIGKQYGIKELNTHPIMWEATSDEAGRLYFANNEGVTRFSGQLFYTFKTPNPVRSMALGENHKIYIASLGDFGVLSFTQQGGYTYQSYRKSLPQEFGKTGGNEQVLKVGKSIYFSCQNYLVQLNIAEQTFTNHKKALDNNAGIFAFESKLYVNTLDYGLGIFEKGKIKIIAGGNLLFGKFIAAKTSNKNKLILAEPNGQCYELGAQKLSKSFKIPEGDMIAISHLPGEKYAVGTLNNGVFLIDARGNKLEQIETQSKEIYSLFTDQEGNLWTAHNKGLQHTWLQVPIKEINTQQISGNISDITVFQSHIYVSSSAGLYRYDGNKITQINKQTAEFWDMQVYQNKLYVASTNGLYIYENNALTLVLPGETLLHMQLGNLSQKLFALGENGIWHISSLGSAIKVEGTPALCKSLIEDASGIRYVLSYQDGLHDLKTNMSFYSHNAGKNMLRIWNGKPYLQNKQQLYALPVQSEEEPSDAIATKCLGLNQNKELNCTEGSLLFTQNGMRVLVNNEAVEQAYLSVLSELPVASIELDKQIWVAYSDKIYVVNPSKNNFIKAQINIESLQSKGDSFAFIGYHFSKEGLAVENQEIIPNISNDALPLRIHFSLHSLVNPEQHRFSIKIDEQDGKWSDWQQQPYIDWASTSGGNYTIHVKGKDAFGQVSEEKIFKFYVKVPWYLSGIAILMYLVCIALIVYFIVILNQKQLITKNKKLEEKVKERTKELEEEKDKSDNLLLNILPHEVAEELKSTGKYEAKQFDDITVLFTDFVGFTSISEKLSPKELVAEIHYCFKAFDEIIGRCKLEKIKTIGDAYMAVCGMPNKDSSHAIRTVEAALEIDKFIKLYQQERKEANKTYFEIRMGIHSGSVIAGIVGVKKYAYDIWGDTVNTAARMEQNSEPGKINISGVTHELIKSKFKCSYRGKIEAKNKGGIDMYFVQNSL